MQAVLDVYDAARALGRAGVPASVIEGFDLGPLVRAKETVASDDADGVARIAGDVLSAMKELG